MIFRGIARRGGAGLCMAGLGEATSIDRTQAVTTFN